VQHGAAGAIDGASIFTIEGTDVRIGAIRGIHVGETFPSFANADYGAAEFRRAVDHGFDYGIEAGHVAPAGQDGDLIFCGH
jgi:hypothetical protein